MFDKITITISWDLYEELLKNQFDRYEKTPIRELVFPDFLNYINEVKGLSENPNHLLNDPDYLVDNFIINGEYGSFDEYKKPNETDEEFLNRVEGDNILIYPEQRVIVFHWGC